MKEWLMAFLHELEVAIPPGEMRHHAITAAKYGSDESGWEPKLALQISVDGKFRTMFLDADDFKRSPEKVIEDVVALLRT